MNSFMLSKKLCYILRHRATKLGIDVGDDGYMKLDDVLDSDPMLHDLSVDDVRKIVDNNDKKRFTLLERDGIMYIRANQGHTMKQTIKSESLLAPVTDDNIVAIHGTYYKNLPYIRKDGLSRMKRNHIHFSKGLPGSSKVISGMRYNVEVLIYLNVPKILSCKSLPLYESTNGVILCEGNERGYIKPEFFSKIVDIRTGKQI